MSLTRPTAPSATQPSAGFNLTSAIQSGLRIICLAIGAILICIGSSQVADVFSQIRGLVTTGEGFEQAVGNMSEAIGGEKLAVNDPNGEAVIEFGRPMAMIFLFAWYFLWSWIPLAVLRVAGVVLALTLRAGK